MQVSQFTDKDTALAKTVGRILGKARFDVNIEEAVELYQALAWLASLPNKINAHVSEPPKVVMPEPKKKKKGKD